MKPTTTPLHPPISPHAMASVHGAIQSWRSTKRNSVEMAVEPTYR
jgi:hypothetical protein